MVCGALGQNQSQWEGPGRSPCLVTHTGWLQTSAPCRRVSLPRHGKWGQGQSGERGHKGKLQEVGRCKVCMCSLKRASARGVFPSSQPWIILFLFTPGRRGEGRRDESIWVGGAFQAKHAKSACPAQPHKKQSSHIIL